jgi:hypothetical protein
MSERPLGDIVNVLITRASKGISREGFGLAALVATLPKTVTRETTLTKSAWATTLSGLGITSASTGDDLALYNATQDHFSQEPSPNTAYLILNLATRQDITITAYDVLTTYTINVIGADGTSTPYTTIAAGTAPATATALAAAVGAHAEVTAVGVGSDVQITTAGGLFYVTGSVNAVGAGTIDAVPSVGTYENLDTSLTAAAAVSDEWYGLITVGTSGRLLAQQTLVSAWAETNKKLYIGCSDVANIKDTTDAADSTTIAAVIKANAYKQSSCFYHEDAVTEYVDAALLGRCLPLFPGTTNWTHKGLSSVTAGDFTATQRTNLEAKRCLFYESFGGSGRTQSGTDGQNGYGDWIDLTRLSNWLESTITVDLASLLVTVEKIPYTNQGARMVKGVIEAVMQEGVDKGAISNEPGFEPWCTVPDISDVATATRAGRTLPDIKFGCYAAAAINRLNPINGTLSV